jgi:rhodanese-related sulfurtransferase
MPTDEATRARRVDIPLTRLRARLDELPRDREILVICRSAHRAHCAARIRLQNGFRVRNLSKGMISRSMLTVKRCRSTWKPLPVRES